MEELSSLLAVPHPLEEAGGVVAKIEAGYGSEDEIATLITSDVASGIDGKVDFLRLELQWRESIVRFYHKFVDAFII